jgi:hypothetical protein
MSVAKELSPELQSKIEDLLRSNPALRDSDRKLSCRLWTNILGGENTVKTKYTAYDFLVYYSNDKGNLPSQESIGRARRKIQNEKVELRGTKYVERHEAQKEVKKKLGYKNLGENYQDKS